MTEEKHNSLKVGDRFTATVKLGLRSKRLNGTEGAGDVLGPFICTKIRRDPRCKSYVEVESKDMHFYLMDFEIARV